jgi:hypothetical protein
MNLLQIWKRLVKLKILMDAQQFDTALEEIERLAKKSNNPQLDKWRLTCRRQIARREYQLACELLEEGNCKGAVKVLEQIENWYAKIEKKRQKKLHEARRLYREGTLKEKSGAEAVTRARELAQNGHLDEAIARLQLLPNLSGEGRELLDTIRRRKQEIAAEVDRAHGLLKEGDIDGAEKLCQELCSACGDELKILKLLAADIDTARCMAQLEKAEKLEGRGRFDEAADIIEQLQLQKFIPDEKKVERIIGHHREFHLQRGEIALEIRTERGLQQARHHLEQIRRLSPNHADASYLAHQIARLETEFERGRRATVQEYVEKGKSLYLCSAPDPRSALMYFDMALAEDGKHPEAISFKRRVEEELSQIGSDWQEALQAFEEQDFSRARSLLSESKAQFHPEATRQLAKIDTRQRQVGKMLERARRTEDPREGLRLLREEIPAIWPDWDTPIELESQLRRMLSCIRRLDAARGAFASGDKSKAIELLNRALLESSTLPDWQLPGGKLLLEQWEEVFQASEQEEIRRLCDAGRFPEAATSARQAASVLRERPDLRQIFRDRLAKIEESRQALEKLCQQAEEAIVREDVERASSLIEEMSASFPSYPDTEELRRRLAHIRQEHEEGASANAHFSAAEEKLEAGHFRDAIANFDRVLDLVPDHAEALRGKNRALDRYMEMQERWNDAIGWVEEKQYQRAITALEALARDEPECQLETSDMLSQIETTLRESDSICDELRDEPDPYRAQLLADRLKRIDPHRDGLHALDAILARQVDLTAIREKSRTAEERGDLPGAIEALRQAAKLQDEGIPDLPFPLACMQTGSNIPNALSRIESALKEECLCACNRLLADRQYAQCTERVEETLKILPNDGELLAQRQRLLDQREERERGDTRTAQADQLLAAIQTEPNLRVARMRLDNELLGALYPDYPPALEFRAALEERFKAWTDFQRGMRGEKGTDLATLRRAIDSFRQVQHVLLHLDIDLSSAGIDAALVEQHLQTARANLRGEYLRQLDQALSAGQFLRAGELLEQGFDDFPDDGDLRTRREALAARRGMGHIDSER